MRNVLDVWVFVSLGLSVSRFELLRQKGFCQHHQPGMGASQEVMLLCRGSKFTPKLCLLSENPAKTKKKSLIRFLWLKRNGWARSVNFLGWSFESNFHQNNTLFVLFGSTNSCALALFCTYAWNKHKLTSTLDGGTATQLGLVITEVSRAGQSRKQFQLRFEFVYYRHRIRCTA